MSVKLESTLLISTLYSFHKKTICILITIFATTDTKTCFFVVALFVNTWKTKNERRCIVLMKYLTGDEA